MIVYNVLGRQVAALVDRALPGVHHQVMWKEDVLWLYQTLRASLDNGFAQILAD